MARRTRNTDVHKSVNDIIETIDRFIAGEKLKAMPEEDIRLGIDKYLQEASSSRVLASTFLLAYSINVTNYDFERLPIGSRGKHGDKKLSNELNRRYVTSPSRISAFGENIGTKGNVSDSSLKGDNRFSILQMYESLSIVERRVSLNYILWKFYDSIKRPRAMPDLDDTYLTFGRCVHLFEQIVRTPSSGYYPQFLVCSILRVHRKGLTVLKTHHPHAADKYDNTVGDIEEFYNDILIAAYEVTVRSDWRNRIEVFREKMKQGNLKKYVIIAGDVASDASTSEAQQLLNFTNKVGFDLAVVDIYEFIKVFVADLTAEQLTQVINLTYEYLIDESLCGRVNMIDKYQSMINKFMQKSI